MKRIFKKGLSYLLFLVMTSVLTAGSVPAVMAGEPGPAKTGHFSGPVSAARVYDPVCISNEIPEDTFPDPDDCFGEDPDFAEMLAEIFISQIPTVEEYSEVQTRIFRDMDGRKIRLFWEWQDVLASLTDFLSDVPEDLDAGFLTENVDELMPVMGTLLLAMRDDSDSLYWEAAEGLSAFLDSAGLTVPLSDGGKFAAVQLLAPVFLDEGYIYDLEPDERYSLYTAMEPAFDFFGSTKAGLFPQYLDILTARLDSGDIWEDEDGDDWEDEDGDDREDEDGDDWEDEDGDDREDEDGDDWEDEDGDDWEDGDSLYVVVTGKYCRWREGSDESVTITVERTEEEESCFEHFTGVQIDEEDLAEDDYTAEEGSTIVTLPPESLAELDTGFHDVTILFDDGDAAASLYIMTEEEDLLPVADARKDVSSGGKFIEKEITAGGDAAAPANPDGGSGQDTKPVSGGGGGTAQEAKSAAGLRDSSGSSEASESSLKTTKKSSTKKSSDSSSKKSSSGQGGSADTGDTSGAGFWAALSTAGLAGVILMAFLMVRRNRKQQLDRTAQ